MNANGAATRADWRPDTAPAVVARTLAGAEMRPGASDDSPDAGNASLDHCHVKVRRLPILQSGENVWQILLQFRRQLVLRKAYNRFVPD